MNYTGPERRQDRLSELNDMRNRLADIQLNLGKIEVKLDGYHSNLKAYRETVKAEIDTLNEALHGTSSSEGLKSKVNAFEKFYGDFKIHEAKDMRFQFVILAGILGILAKVMFFN